MSLTLGGGPLAARPPESVNYRIDGPAHRLFQHPFPRRVRALFAGRTVLGRRRDRGLRHPGRAVTGGIGYRRSVKTNAKTNALRAGTLTAGTAALTALLTSPAFALDDGAQPGQGISVMETLGLYVVAPVGLFLIIAALVMIGDKSRKQQKD